MIGRVRAAAAASTALFVLISVAAVDAQAIPRVIDTGFLYSPFREDGAPFDAGTGTFGGARGDDGCLVDEPQADRDDCLPAAAAQTLLADSRILYWNAIEGGEAVDGAVALQGGDVFIDDQSRVLELDYAASRGRSWIASGTGAFPGTPKEPPLIPGVDPRENPDSASDASLFCSDQKILHDGRVLAVGGTNYYAEPGVAERVGVAELEGIRNTRIFDPVTNLWSKAPDMHYGRWYPSMVTLANGDLFVASGVTKLIKPVYPSHVQDSGTNVRQTETFTASSANPTFVDNGRAADRSLPLYPRLHLLPNGNVYYDAAGQAFNPAGQSYDQALWNEAAVYNPKTRTWRGLGVPGLTGLESSAVEPGFRGSTFSQMLTLKPGPKRDYGTASFLTAGGVVGGSPGSYVATPTARINHVTMGDGEQAETLRTFDAGLMHTGRWYSSGVVLTNGQVFVVGGGDVDGVVGPGAERPILQTEIFTPNGQGGDWRLGPVIDRDRSYHNSAILLPTGQVLIGGHAPIPNGYGPVSNNPDTPVRDAVNNFKDASFQIYTPPNLSRAYDRPVINGNIRESVDHGSRLVIPTNDADTIHNVVMARNPSVTHLIDGDQRMVELPIVARSRGRSVTVEIPRASVLPPGPYMLFINRDVTPRGAVNPDHLVPSIARQVFVGAPAPPGVRQLPQTPHSPRRP